MYFTAYPVSRRHRDHAKLDLRAFDPGAFLHGDREKSVLADPLRDPKAFVPSLLSNAATFGDKLRTLGLAGQILPGRAVAAGRENGGVDSSTLEYLRESGLSERYIDSFFRPFYGGIFLNCTLGTSARVFRFTFRVLAVGRTVIPARGMAEIPKQLASHLPEGTLRLRSPVDALLREGERVVGVRATGRSMRQTL